MVVGRTTSDDRLSHKSGGRAFQEAVSNCVDWEMKYGRVWRSLSSRIRTPVLLPGPADSLFFVALPHAKRQLSFERVGAVWISAEKSSSTLSMNGGLNDEERVLLEYYLNELIWKILSGHPTMQPRDTESPNVRKT